MNPNNQQPEAEKPLKEYTEDRIEDMAVAAGEISTFNGIELDVYTHGVETGLRRGIEIGRSALQSKEQELKGAKQLLDRVNQTFTLFRDHSTKVSLQNDIVDFLSHSQINSQPETTDKK